MQHTLTIAIDRHAIAVERLLQVTRYRGFHIAGLSLIKSTDTHQQTMTLQIESERPIHLLVNQLNKVHHVLDLNLCSPGMQQAIN